MNAGVKKGTRVTIGTGKKIWTVIDHRFHWCSPEGEVLVERGYEKKWTLTERTKKV